MLIKSILQKDGITSHNHASVIPTTNIHQKNKVQEPQLHGENISFKIKFKYPDSNLEKRASLIP